MEPIKLGSNLFVQLDEEDLQQVMKETDGKFEPQLYALATDKIEVDKEVKSKKV